MITLDAPLKIPAHVSFSVVGEDAFLLNAKNAQYYALSQVGARLWQLLGEGKLPREAHQFLLQEYDVEAATLETDLLELLQDLQKNELIEIA
ncbi:MAG: hypothetical protein Fur002_21380 [Anaerolineales bacterium]